MSLWPNALDHCNEEPRSVDGPSSPGLQT